MRAQVFEAALATRLAQAQAAGRASLTVKSGDLHRDVGGYPGTNHRMPVCCQVMRAAMLAKDRIVEAPPKGMVPLSPLNISYPVRNRPAGPRVL